MIIPSIVHAKAQLYMSGGTEFVQTLNNRVEGHKAQVIDKERQNATQLPERSSHVTNEMQRQQNKDIEETVNVSNDIDNKPM